MVRIAASVGALAIVVAAIAVSRHGDRKVNHTAGKHGLEGWAPQKITDEKQEKKEIEEVLQEIHAAYRSGDQAAVAARIQFPVLMITDDWKGEVLTRSWDRDKWMRVMAPLFEHPATELQREHQHHIFLISDSLASVDDEQSVVLGKKKVTIRSSSILIRKDRNWFVQASVEGGWGDTRVGKQAVESTRSLESGSDARAATDAPAG